jgi:hypothetical protein
MQLCPYPPHLRVLPEPGRKAERQRRVFRARKLYVILALD